MYGGQSKLAGLVLITHESWVQTQVTRPCDKHLHSLSHLTAFWQDLDFEASWVVE